MDLVGFINRNYIQGIVSDSSYNHIDMLTYVIILFAGVYIVLKLLKKLRIKVDEEFVIATIPYVFMGSVFRVVEDAELLSPPLNYLFITPLIYFVVFAVCFSMLLLTRYLKKTGRIKNYIRAYAVAGIILSFTGMVILVFSSYSFNLKILTYSVLSAVALTGIVKVVSPSIGMAYLRSSVYSFAIFSFLLDSITTYMGTTMGYTNKHPFSSFLTSFFGSGIVLVPLSLLLIILIILLLEKDSGNDEEKYMFALTLIVLGFSMGARNLLALGFGF